MSRPGGGATAASGSNPNPNPNPNPSQERESHELSKLKQTEYNLRVSAAKVYKLEASRRAKAEKAYREGKTHWMVTDKRLRAEAEAKAKKLKGKARAHARKQEVKRRLESKQVESKRG